MDRKRFEEILEAYGADAARWPETERDAALRLAATEPDLAVAYATAGTLDRLLAHAPSSEVSNALLTRIFESAPRAVASPLGARRAQMKPRGWQLPIFGGALALRPATILVLAIGLGLGAGALMPSSVDASPAEVGLLSDLLGTPVFNQDGGDW